MKEPFQAVECELLDRHHGQGAGLLAALVSSHSDRHQQQVGAFLTELRRRFG
jgi:hypothetical protein